MVGLGCKRKQTQGTIIDTSGSAADPGEIRGHAQLELLAGFWDSGLAMRLLVA